MITVEEAKAKIARGEKLGRQDAIDLLELQLAKKPAGYVYTNAFGETATPGVAIQCYNLHPNAPVDKDEFLAAVNARESADGEGVEWVPGCIVGSVFVDLVGIDATPATGSAAMTNLMVGRPFSYHGQNALGVAQMRQDQGDTWEVAVQAAKECSPGN